jgi:hypothetical protein
MRPEANRALRPVNLDTPRGDLPAEAIDPWQSLCNFPCDRQGILIKIRLREITG